MFQSKKGAVNREATQRDPLSYRLCSLLGGCHVVRDRL